MNLDDLRRTKNRERETDSLQELPDSFYADVADYIRERKAERAAIAEEVDDPFSSSEISQLSDEIETAEQLAESLYERRVGKVVKQASFAAADMGGGSEDNLTAEERELYADLVERIKRNKRRVIDVVAGEADGESAAEGADATSTDATSADGPTEPDAGAGARDDADGTADDVDAADLMGDGAADPDADDGEGDDRTTVRITQDVGEVFGVDQHTYTLETDDVVTLPDENAAPLVERDAAEPLE